MASRAFDDVLVVPISFVSEHIETLYELDILYKKVARRRRRCQLQTSSRIEQRSDVHPRACGYRRKHAVQMMKAMQDARCRRGRNHRADVRVALQKLGIETLVLEEARLAVGGVIRSETRSNGHLVEWGPDLAAANSHTPSQLLEELGLGDDLEQANPKSPRYIVVNGDCDECPSGR